MSQDAFEPRIVGFLCNWCSYTGADLAGTARMTYAPNVRIIRVMCTGRVDPAVRPQGLPGGRGRRPHLRLPSGRLPLPGRQYKALRRHRLLSRVLEQFGIETGAVPAGMGVRLGGDQFQQVCNEFTEQSTSSEASAPIWNPTLPAFIG